MKFLTFLAALSLVGLVACAKPEPAPEPTPVPEPTATMVAPTPPATVTTTTTAAPKTAADYKKSAKKHPKK